MVELQAQLLVQLDGNIYAMAQIIILLWIGTVGRMQTLFNPTDRYT